MWRDRHPAPTRHYKRITTRSRLLPCVGRAVGGIGIPHDGHAEATELSGDHRRPEPRDLGSERDHGAFRAVVLRGPDLDPSTRHGLDRAGTLFGPRCAGWRTRRAALDVSVGSDRWWRESTPSPCQMEAAASGTRTMRRSRYPPSRRARPIRLRIDCRPRASARVMHMTRFGSDHFGVMRFGCISDASGSRAWRVPQTRSTDLMRPKRIKNGQAADAGGTCIRRGTGPSRRGDEGAEKSGRCGSRTPSGTGATLSGSRKRRHGRPSARGPALA